MKRNINLRIMAVTVALVLIATFGVYLPGTQVCAATITDPLDFTLDQADEKYPGTAGDGWAWNAASKNLTLDGLDLACTTEDQAIKLPDGSTIIIADDSENSIIHTGNKGIVCCGDLDITGSGILDVTVYSHGIRAVGDLSIDGLTSLNIQSDTNMGIRTGKGNKEDSGSEGSLSIKNCASVKIKSNYESIRAIGNVLVNGVDSLTLYSENYKGILAGPGNSTTLYSGVPGHISILNCGTVSVTSYTGGFRAWGDVHIEAVDNFTITSDQNGIRCGPDEDMDKTTSAEGNLDIINCGKVNITDTGKNAVAVYGNMIARNVTSLNMIGEDKGLKTWGTASFIDCGTVKAIGRVEYDGFSDYEAYEGFGIMSGEGVLIKNTTLEAYGAQYGIVTGCYCYESDVVPTGGDIVINKSNVYTSCAEDGFAAIYAGDDGVVHSSILLTDAAIISPENGYIVDVDIAYTCQTVTALPNLSLVENWGQAAKSVTFGALYQVQYDANGGTGTLTDASGPYLPASDVNVLANSFAKAGFEFIGWNTRADGTGTTYLAGDAFAIASDMTLYAIYKELPPPTTTTTEATTPTTEPTTTTTEVTTTEVIHISTTTSHDHLPATGENNLSQIVAGIALLLAGAGVSMLLLKNKAKERQ